MGVLCKADYYYGALLSVLINGGLAPALFEKENGNRQIYEVSTNNDDYMIYTKYHTSPTGSKDFTWSFTFSDRELVEIKKLKDENKDKTLVFAFICSQKQLSDYNQEIAVVYWDEFTECIDMNKKDYRGTARLSIKLIKGARALRIYGSKRGDVLDGKDNTIKIERNRLSSLLYKNEECDHLESTERRLNMFSIKQEMKKLAQKHPFFSSKEAFKNALKHQLQEKFRVIENKDFHGCVVDLWVEDPNSEQCYAIYLMNKLGRLTTQLENRLIELKNHGAQDIGRYDFLKQVEKLEKITTGSDNIKGIAILLTNDHLYWSEPTRANTVDSYFRIHENRILTGELKWMEHASAGTTKDRENPIVIKGTYKLQWQDYSTVSNEKHGEFRYLAVHVGVE